MRTIRTLLGIGIAGAVVFTGLPGVALAAPTAPYTVLTVDVGDHTGYPIYESGVYDTGNSTLSVQPTVGDRVSIRADSGGEYVSLTIAPPSGQSSFTEGVMYEANRSGADGAATLDMGASGRGCGNSYGTLTVNDLEREGETGLISSLALAYRYGCTTVGGNGWITGEFRWKSDVGYRVAHAEPSPVSFGWQEIGVPSATRTVTFRSVGSQPVTFGAASLGGSSPAAFEIVGGDCTGRTVDPGQTCTMSVRTKPSKREVQTATLLLTDDTEPGVRRVRLSTEGFVGSTGTYYSLPPKRLMDTRSGLGVPKAKIGAGKKVDLQVTGRGGVPASGVGAVVLNVTVAGPTASSFVTAWPAGQGRPTASSVNFTKGWLGSNNVTVKVGSGGKVSFYNHAGSTDVIVDVVGVWAGDNTLNTSRGTGAQYHWVEPFRLYDTREDIGKLKAGWEITGWADFGQYNREILGYVVNITAVSPARSGFLTAWSGIGERPNASTVNYAAGKVVPNLAYVQATPCYEEFCTGNSYGDPAFTVYTSQTTHVVVDVVGVVTEWYVPDGLRFTPMSPTRILDSRSGLGTPSALGPNVTRTVTAPESVVTDATEALAMNVTAVAPTTGTVITLWPAGYPGLEKPGTSNLNPAAGQTVANAVMGPIGPNDAFHVHNLLGTTHVLADVVGRFDLYPGTATTATAAASGAAGPSGLTARDAAGAVRP